MSNMIIEALARWTELKTPKKDDTESYIQRLTNPEADQGQSSQQLEVHYDYSPLVFNLKDVKRFNRANDPSHTTIRFYDGDSNVIKYPYNDFLRLYSDLTGYAINCIVPVESSSSNEAPDEDEEDDYNDSEGNDDFRDI